MKEADYTLFVDCGAPSLYNKLSRAVEKKGVMGSTFKDRKLDDYSYVESVEYIAYREALIDFLLENKKKIDVYSNLDVINNPKLTRKNQKLMEKAGLNPIPVFHLGNDVKYLDRMIEKYDYIALGGLVPNPTSVLMPILDKLFKKHICDKDGVPKVKVHGFACTSFPLMQAFPWYSVDSATCRKLGNYGFISWLEPGNNRIVTKDISSRKSNNALKSQRTGLFKDREIPTVQGKIPKGMQEQMNIVANEWGTSFDALVDNTIERVIWNYLVFLSSIEKFIPKWPWSIHTRESAPGADELLHFYLAGAFSSNDMKAVWKRLAELNIPATRKHRLNSFFYKGETERDIKFKAK
jgi:hypothetical protein